MVGKSGYIVSLSWTWREGQFSCSDCKLDGSMTHKTWDYKNYLSNGNVKHLEKQEYFYFINFFLCKLSITDYMFLFS